MRVKTKYIINVLLQIVKYFVNLHIFADKRNISTERQMLSTDLKIIKM